MGLPGVRVGPLDPDSTSEFGQVSQHHSARTLIRLHAQMFPGVLTRELAKKLDPLRTKGLDLAEVQGYVEGLELENGDPVLPDGARVVGAAVRGDRDRPQVLTFVYELRNRDGSPGRTGKWFAPYDRDALGKSAEAGDEFVRVHELRERGIVSFDESATNVEVLRRRESALLRENAALRGLVERGEVSDGEDVPHGAAEHSDARPDVAIVEENEQLRTLVRDLSERLTVLEAQHAESGLADEDTRRAAGAIDERDPVEVQLDAAGGVGPSSDEEREAAAAGEQDRPGQRQTPPDVAAGSSNVAEQDPPTADYDDLNAADVIKRIRDEDTSAEDVRAILEYERTHANRRTVVGAAEETLGRTG